jgi:hypothetical protein
VVLVSAEGVVRFGGEVQAIGLERVIAAAGRFASDLLARQFRIGPLTP